MRHDGLFDVANVPEIYEIIDEAGQEASVGGDGETMHGPCAGRVHDGVALCQLICGITYTNTDLS